MDQSKYIIRIRKDKWRELFIGLLFVVPYIEPFIGGTWQIGDSAVGRAVLIPECLIILINSIHFVKTRNAIRIHHGAESLFCFYIIGVLLLNTSITAANISMAAWMIVPLVCALTIHTRLLKDGIDCDLVIRYGVFFFTGYTIALVAYNVLVLGLLATGHRLTALAGGPVIFGYTLAVYFALVVSNKAIFSDTEATVFKIIFTGVAILTGSRGGVWPIVLLWAFDFIRSKFSYKRLFLAGLFLVILIVVNPLEYIYAFMPRLFDSTDTARLGSNFGAFRAYSSLGMYQMITGCGPGGCFPYQAWVNRNVALGSTVGNRNRYVFNGASMLVQPHNAALYYLLELGIIGVLLVAVIIVKNMDLLRRDNRTERVVIIGTIVVVNMFDSVLIVEPGVAFVLWLLILINSRKKNDYRKGTVLKESGV